MTTTDERASAICMGLGFGRVFPTPDGVAHDQADWQHMALLYRGILATAEVVTDIIFRPRPAADGFAARATSRDTLAARSRDASTSGGFRAR